MVNESMWKRSFHYCQAQPQLKPNWAELVLIPIPPTAGRPSGIVNFSPNRQIISKRKGTRLVWKFDSLAPKEERLLSYEIKSKIHVIGKLNIPQASLVQTKSGKKISKIFSGKLNLTGK